MSTNVNTEHSEVINDRIRAEDAAVRAESFYQSTVTMDATFHGYVFNANQSAISAASSASDANTALVGINALDNQNVKLTGNQTVAGAKTFSSNPYISAVQSSDGNAITKREFVISLDGQNVKLTGNQTIIGVKTFSSNPQVPNGVSGSDAINFSQVIGLDNQNVKLTGNQTIAGAKTFSSNPISPAGQSSAGDSLTKREFVTGLDSHNVKLTGNQTIAGVKTFSSNPKVPNGISDTDAVNFSQIAGLDGQNVKLAGNQIVAGTKTFNNNPQVPNGVSGSDAVNFSQVIGIGQTWQDVTASRFEGVVYTNTTGKPIFVYVRIGRDSENHPSSVAIFVEHVAFHNFNQPGGNGAGTESMQVALVPANSNYRYHTHGDRNREILELR